MINELEERRKAEEEIEMEMERGEQGQHGQHGGRLPERIILVRHGESAGNLDSSAYSNIPDHQIPLTPLGRRQAREAGRAIRRMLDAEESDGGEEEEKEKEKEEEEEEEEKKEKKKKNWGAYFYVSPYERTRSTLREMARAFPRWPSACILGAREECRIREQDFGNFQVVDRMRAIQEARQRFGRFFFRFPEGESAADVYDRVASFLESLWRDIDMHRLCHDPSTPTNLIIVTHGLTSRVFLMKWFKWTVSQFELLNNPANCEFRVMQLGPTGEYSLLPHHSPHELHLWGLSPEMIADQHCRATSSPNDFDFGGYLTKSFFDDHDDDHDHDDDDSHSLAHQDANASDHPHPHPHLPSPSLPPNQDATTHGSC